MAEQESVEPKRRRCWKYVPEEFPFSQLKAGDIYQLERFSHEDQAESYLYMAEKDAEINDDKINYPSSTAVVEASRLIKDPSFGDV